MQHTLDIICMNSNRTKREICTEVMNMKKEIRKITLSLALIILVMTVFTGCGIQKADYGESIITCSSKNFIGFAGAYIDEENRVTLVFDRWYTMNVFNSDPGLRNIFNKGAYTKDKPLRVNNKKTRFSIDINDDEIKVDKWNMTISFVIGEDLEPDDFKDFYIYTDSGSCTIRFHDLQIYGDYSSGKKDIIWMQYYDESKDSWLKVEKETPPTYDGGPNHTLPD